MWDLPTRLFHWTLLVCVVGAYVTVKIGGLWMDWHVRFGLATLALLIFRIIWGLIGPHHVRFQNFIRGPRVVLAYLRGNHAHVAGHNPMGAGSVIALLLVLIIQATSGLFADDDIFTTGPLAYLSSAWSAQMTGLHRKGEWFIVALVALHVGAIYWYQGIKRKDIVRPMISGDTQLPPDGMVPPATRDDGIVRLGALLLFAAICTLVWWLTTLAPVADFSSFM